MIKYILVIVIFIGFIILYWWTFKGKKEEIGTNEIGTVRRIIKDIVLKGQNSHCTMCTETKYLVLHHKVPRAAGGDNRLSNLVYLCPNHHAEIHGGAYNRMPKEVD